VTRLRSALLSLLLLLVSLGLVTALVEVAARVLVARAAPPAGGPARPISRYDAQLGWDKPPNGEQRIQRSEFDVTIRTNSKGLRGPEREYAKPAGTRRVLILGDSFGEGYYVEEEQTARALLEGGLNLACPPVEVLNAATAGYSTDQEYLFYAREGRRYGSDLVLVFFYYNDVYYNTSGMGTGGKPKPVFEERDGQLVLGNVPVPERPDDSAGRVAGLIPWRGSIALRLLSNRTSAGAPRLHGWLARVGLVEPLSREPYKEFWPVGGGHRDEVGEMWRRTALILQALQRDVQAAGGRLAVLYVPARFEINDTAMEEIDTRFHLGLRKAPNRIFKQLKSICDAAGIPVLDPRPALRAAERPGRPAYYPNDGHWNAIGNAVAAQELVPFVRPLLPACR